MKKIQDLFLGRVNCIQWLLGILALSLPPSIMLAVIAQLVEPETDVIATAFPFIAGLLLIPAFVLSISLHIRRMHDINLNGFYLILAFIPLINLYYLYLLLKKGDEGINTYGEPPKKSRILSVVFNTQSEQTPIS